MGIRKATAGRRSPRLSEVAREGEGAPAEGGRAGRARRKPSAFSSWQTRYRKGHPDGREAAALLPPRVYEAEKNPDLPRHDGLGLPVPRGISVKHERLMEVLRFLGRVYVADIETVYRMLYSRRYSVMTAYRDLEALAAQRLVWVTNAPAMIKCGANHNNSSTSSARLVFGLSTIGKKLLGELRVEPDERSLELLVARDIRSRPPKPDHLDHDLQVTWWCASMVEGLRLLPWCTTVYCQTEFRSAKKQRVDAVVVARFTFERPRRETQVIPWFDGTPLQPDEVELRWALELDNSTESVNVLIDKFCAYRDLHYTGSYHRIFHGDLMLVLIVQNARRASYLAAEFKRAWPGGWGLVSTPDGFGANSTPYGALWGRYVDMATGGEVPLIAELTRDSARRVSAYTPLMTYPLWLAYLERLKAGRAPAALYELMEGGDGRA